MKSKRNSKNKSKSKKLYMSVKIKKELEKLTKEWIESLPNIKKKNSKIRVNKFINTLKKKCNHK